LSIIRRQERERLVIDLYNQGKIIREIAKEVRISFRDIKVILDEVVEEKTEASKEQGQDNNNNGVENNQQEPHLSLAAQAYKLFSERKTPLEVANTLNLGQAEVIKLYREYWKLKRLHRLYSAYTELGDEGLGDFLKLYRLMKEKEVSNEQVANYVAMPFINFLIWNLSMHKPKISGEDATHKTRIGKRYRGKKKENITFR
jgi:transposase